MCVCVCVCVLMCVCACARARVPVFGSCMQAVCVDPCSPTEMH